MDFNSKLNVTLIIDLGALQEGSMEGRQGSWLEENLGMFLIHILKQKILKF